MGVLVAPVVAMCPAMARKNISSKAPEVPPIEALIVCDYTGEWVKGMIALVRGRDKVK